MPGLLDLLSLRQGGGGLLGNFQSNYAQLPVSANIEDRRGFSFKNLIADLAHRTAGALTESPVPWHQSEPVFPSGPYSNDIAGAAQLIGFESKLDEMHRRELNKGMLDAYFNSQHPEGFNSTPPIFLNRRR